MKRLSLLQHQEVRRGLVIYLASTVSAVLCSLSACQILTLQLEPSIGVAGVVVATLVGGLLLVFHLNRLMHWDCRLAAIAKQQSGELNPFDIPSFAGDSPAGHGWNRLLEAGKQWQALRQLEQSVASQVEDLDSRSTPPLLDALTDGVATVDAAGVVTYANSSLASICGVSSAESLIGRSLIELVTSDAETATVLQSSVPQASIEWKIDSTVGHRVLNGRFRPGRKSDSSTFAYVWTIRDVTQQRLAEAMRDQFLATATHEFRTPLANIRAYAESLHDGAEMDNESRKHFYNVIQSESVRLSQLVDDLLDISRMQAGALSLEPTETDLARLTEEVTAKVQGEISSKEIDFQCELPPKFPPKILVDKSKLSAALVNLLGNATKYTPIGGKVVFRVDFAPNKLQFQISDTGIGISPEELPRVFERFYRSDDDRVRELSGSGLGLALTQEVARLHGGEVTAESQLNHGSTFCMTIPLENQFVN